MLEMNKDLYLESYDYPLEDSFIASRPADVRHNSKLLIYNHLNGVDHKTFRDIVDLIPANSVLVLNQTKVQKARILGKKESGGKAEVFVLSYENKSARALIKCRGVKKVNDIFIFESSKAIIKEIVNDQFIIEFDHEVFTVLENNGLLPIPPYIRGGHSDEKDQTDYQTVFAKESGSVAAPTAGLHFTKDVLNALKAKGVKLAYVTLHVGLGTFSPIKSSNIKNHQMHSESFFIDEKNLKVLNHAKKEGRKIFAVGTTSLRVLESIIDPLEDKFVFDGEKFQETDIFIYPGKDVFSIDGLITNFHLPKSSLMMLVSALIGREKLLELYGIAKEKNYRFFSYGDAMLILR